MAHIGTAPTTKASASYSPSKQFNGKCLMADAKEAMYFLQQSACSVFRFFGFSSLNIMNARATREACGAFKADVTRLVTRPIFWLLLVLASISTAAAAVAALLWTLCAPMLLRTSDFYTWCLREDPEKFKGKVAWVTGGSSGIGLALCKHLAVRGVKGLIMTGRSMQRLEAARNEVVAFCTSQGYGFSHEDILLIPIDLSKGLRPTAGAEEAAAAEVWEEAVHQAIRWRGGVDLLFNNAGRLAVGCLPPTETFLEVMDVNVLSVIKLTNMLLPHMRAKDSGHIVFTNSVSAYFNFGGFSAYATSKVALLSYTNLLRQDLRGCGSKGVLVTSVHPGYVATNIFQNLSDPLVDPSCKRDTPVQWDGEGLDVDVTSSLILRAVSRDLEETWLAVPTCLWKVYVSYYLPQLVRLVRRFTAQKECAHTSEYREQIVSQLTGCTTSLQESRFQKKHSGRS